ncbi:MAG: hypothetical protein GXP40_11755 [Chloroflexi bacterium]|nr:hypothetical protein [Chloroflexota bacterium]
MKFGDLTFEEIKRRLLHQGGRTEHRDRLLGLAPACGCKRGSGCVAGGTVSARAKANRGNIPGHGHPGGPSVSEAVLEVGGKLRAAQL